MARKRVNGAGTINQGKDGYWRAKIQIGTDENGRAKFKSFSGTSKAAVRKKLDAYRMDLGSHKAEFEAAAERERKEKAEKYLGDSIIEWAFTYKKNKLKPESFKRLLNTIMCQIVPRIGEVRICDLTYDKIQMSIINDMYEEGLSLSSIKKAKSALNDFYKHWQKIQMLQGKMLVNIVEMTTLPSIHNFNTKEIKCMTDDEVGRFVKYLDQKDESGEYLYSYRDLVLLMLNTGIRLSEACALKIEDYNLQDKTLFIRRNVVEVPTITQEGMEINMSKNHLEFQSSTKSSSGFRKIPLNSAAIDCLNNLCSKNELCRRKTPFLAITNTGECVWPSNVRKFVNKALSGSGVDLTGAHLLRHTYATALFAQGIDLKTVSTLLGHSNIQITSDIYLHYNESIKYKDTSGNSFKPYPEYLI